MTGKHVKPIRSNLPYPVRERMYRNEKEALFYEMKNMSAAEIQRRQKELADKWEI